MVTGCAGRNGAHIVRTLAEMGHLVNALDHPTASFERVDNQNNVNVFKADLLKPEDVKEACRGMDVVLHLAEIRPPSSEASLERTMVINTTGTRNLVEALESSTALIFPSSVAVYGRTQGEEPPITVDHPCEAMDNYSRSKIAAEAVIRESFVPYAILSNCCICSRTLRIPIAETIKRRYNIGFPSAIVRADNEVDKRR